MFELFIKECRDLLENDSDEALGPEEIARRRNLRRPKKSSGFLAAVQRRPSEEEPESEKPGIFQKFLKAVGIGR
jgi:hypothetical protein